jgi:hypothetical protein
MKTLIILIAATVLLCTSSVGETKCYEKRKTEEKIECVVLQGISSSGLDSTCKFKCKIAAYGGRRTTLIYKKHRWQKASSE